MEITNEFKPNKTFTYLYPCLKAYGIEDYNRLRSILFITMGINDINCSTNDRVIYILYKLSINVSHKKQRIYETDFNNLLIWVRKKPYYVDDYLFSYIKEETHMLVLKIPEEHHNSYDEFLKSNYSKMYNSYYITNYFKNVNVLNSGICKTINNRINKTKSVLIKHNQAKEEFVYTINSHYGTDMTANEYEGELDYPIVLEEEIFNFK